MVVTCIAFQSLSKQKKQKKKNNSLSSLIPLHFRGHPCPTGTSTTFEVLQIEFARILDGSGYNLWATNNLFHLTSFCSFISFFGLHVSPSCYCGALRISFVWEHSSLSLHGSHTRASQRLNKEASHVSPSRSQLSISAPSSSFLCFFENSLHIPTTPLLLRFLPHSHPCQVNWNVHSGPIAGVTISSLFFFLFTPPNVLAWPLRAAWPDTCQRGVGATPHRSAFSPRWKKKKNRGRGEMKARSRFCRTPTHELVAEPRSVQPRMWLITRVCADDATKGRTHTTTHSRLFLRRMTLIFNMMHKKNPPRAKQAVAQDRTDSGGGACSIQSVHDLYSFEP